jgi:FtsZ-interacting cell division protein ZipA
MVDIGLITIIIVCATIIAILVFAKWYYTQHNDSSSDNNEQFDTNTKTHKKRKRKHSKKQSKHSGDSKNEKEINLLVIFSHGNQSVNVKYNQQLSNELKLQLKENFIDPILSQKMFDQNKQPQIGTSEEHFRFTFDDVPYLTHIIYEIHE